MDLHLLGMDRDEIPLPAHVKAHPELQECRNSCWARIYIFFFFSYFFFILCLLFSLLFLYFSLYIYILFFLFSLLFFLYFSFFFFTFFAPGVTLSLLPGLPPRGPCCPCEWILRSENGSRLQLGHPAGHFTPSLASAFPAWPRSCCCHSSLAQNSLWGDSWDAGLSGIAGGCFHLEIVEIDSTFGGENPRAATPSCSVNSGNMFLWKQGIFPQELNQDLGTELF